MYIFYYSKRVEIQIRIYPPPLLEKINNLYIKLFSSSKWNDYFRGY